MHEPVSSARINSPQREHFAIEDDERARAPASGHARAYRIDACLDRLHEPGRLAAVPDAVSNLLQRRRDISEPGMPIDVSRNLRAVQLRAQIRLARINDNEIGPEREDALDVRI